MSDPSALVQMRDIALIYGRNLRVVRSWRERWSDWPAPVGERVAAASRGGVVAFYNAAAVDRCVAAHLKPGWSSERWLVEQVADELGLVVKWVRIMIGRRMFPPPDGYQGRYAWWRPDTVRTWAEGRLVPKGAWTAADVRAHTGHLADTCVRHGLLVDGTVRPGRVRKRWWWPDTVRRWWTQHQAEQEWIENQRQALQDRRSTEAEEVPLDRRDRWFGPDIAEATGLRYDSVRTYRRKGRLPPPDGHTDGGRPWWKPATI